MGPPSNGAAALPVAGRFVDDGAAYRIDGVEGMAPFLMSVVSASWITGSSFRARAASRRGAPSPSARSSRTRRTIGFTRGTASGAAHARPRARTDRGESVLWSPSTIGAVAAGRHRSITKSVLGTRVALEESDVALGLTLRVEWATSERFGFVRTAGSCGARRGRAWWPRTCWTGSST